MGARAISSVSNTFLQRYDKDDLEARNKFVEHHMPLVVSMAKKYVASGVEMDDLVQSGVIGMIEAANRFDQDKGNTFSTYASWWIRVYIEKEIDNISDVMGVTVNYKNHYSKIAKMVEDFEKEHHRHPTVREISQATNLRKSTILSAMIAVQKTLSLDIDTNDMDIESDPCRLIWRDDNTPTPEDACHQIGLRDDVYDFLGCLSERERFLIEHRYGLLEGDELSLRKLAKLMGLSQERVRQIEEEAIKKMQNIALVCNTGYKFHINKSRLKCSSHKRKNAKEK